MNIIIKFLHIENFKGVSDLSIDFSGDTTEIRGQNATGKTTIADAVSWLLFNKDSQGNADFAIRPKNADGADIDNIEIKVSAEFSVDGKSVELTKIQKQKWTKHRGSTAPTFEGNVNEFQIDGFPAKKSEFDGKIASMVDESLFKLLTNPRTFAAMKWQDQRNILMRFASGISTDDILASDPDYVVIADDVRTAGADRARQKANATLKALKKEQGEYPVRIDEALRQITEVPDAEVVMHNRKVAEEEIEAVKRERDSLDTALKSVTDIQSEIVKCKLAMGDIEERIIRENAEVTTNAAREVERLKRDYEELDIRRGNSQERLKHLEKDVEGMETEIADLASLYREVKARELPATETICPTCGREFDQEKMSEVRASFEERKKADLERIGNTGKSLRTSVNNRKAEIESLKNEIDSLRSSIDLTNKKLSAAYEAKERVQEKDYKQDPEHISLAKKMDELMKSLLAMDNGEKRKQALADREADARSALSDADRDLTLIAANQKAEMRVEELKTAQRECGQKVAHQEHIVYLLEAFMKDYMEQMSGAINKHFKRVRFRLFNTLINGAVTETCTMQIASNGSYVDYKDANNAAKIIGGLDVIDALSGLYGVSAPIFLDNAECLNDFNIPGMDAQMILLKVSDDKELVVE